MEKITRAHSDWCSQGENKTFAMFMKHHFVRMLDTGDQLCLVGSPHFTNKSFTLDKKDNLFG